MSGIALPIPRPDRTNGRSVVADILGGDVSAFDAFFEFWYARTHHYVRARIGFEAQAFVAIEAALQRVFEELTDRDRALPLAAWIFGIVQQEVRGVVRGLDGAGGCPDPDRSVSLSPALRERTL